MVQLIIYLRLSSLGEGLERAGFVWPLNPFAATVADSISTAMSRDRRSPDRHCLALPGIVLPFKAPLN